MKRVFAGFYKRCDGTPIYVVDVLKDIDTGEEIVVCKYDLYSNDGYYAITKQSFCEDKAQENGRRTVICSPFYF